MITRIRVFVFQPFDLCRGCGDGVRQGLVFTPGQQQSGLGPFEFHLERARVDDKQQGSLLYLLVILYTQFDNRATDVRCDTD